MPNRVIGNDDVEISVDPMVARAGALGVSLEVLENATASDIRALESVVDESWAMGVEQWVQDNSSRYDPALLGSFMYVMRQRGLHAARAQQFLATFLKWKDEAPTAE